MAKFTILKPPSGQHLLIPTTEGSVINFTFDLDGAQYAVEGVHLRITLPNHIFLVLNDLLRTAASQESAPLLVLPDKQTLNTHELLLSLGVTGQLFEQARNVAVLRPSGSPLNIPAQAINSLLAGTVDMGEPINEPAVPATPEALENLNRHAWINSAYIISTPPASHFSEYRVQLEVRHDSVSAGSRLKMLLYFHHESDPQKLLPAISEPFILYVAFTPMEENYDLIDFLQLARSIVYYDHVVERIWEDSPQGGAYLLKLIMGPGHLPKEKSKPCIKIEIPVYENYLQGASLAVTLAAVVGASLRAGDRLGKSDIKILPNYQAKVLYGIKGSPEALCLTGKSLEIQPPSLVFRALNYQAGDCINIAEIMLALGPESVYTLKQQGHHLVLKMFNAEHSRKLRVVLENTSLESLLGSNAFITGGSSASEYEWLTYRYIDQRFIDDNAVNEADVLITSKTLLNAFLQEEDYASMKIFLENLSRGDY